MATRERKPLSYYIRSLHRDIGFFVIGLTIIYGVSGIFLIYRDTDFLKYETVVQKQLAPNLSTNELGAALRLRDFSVSRDENGVIYFQNGTYNKASGLSSYSAKEPPVLLKKFNALHMSPSKSPVHWFTTVYGALLLFLAISSFWMFNTKTKLFRRGLYLAGSGLLFAVILLFLAR